MLGLILAGGGARGAYEAGVLRYLFREFPRRTGRSFFPKVICGTSVGGLTATWLAAHGANGVDDLSAIWRNLLPSQIYNFEPSDLLSLTARFFRRDTDMEHATALLDPTPLRDLISTAVSWQSLYSRLDRGELDALVIAATDIAVGKATLFTDGVRSPRQRPTTIAQRTRMRPEHCLASAAIPFVFPPVSVEGRFYLDGSLRQNTPLSPAISLGVTRAIVVGVKRLRSEEDAADPFAAPTAAFLAGKALNALMLDPVEEDLRQLRAINAVLDWGQQAYPDFVSRMHKEHRPFRTVRTVFIRPSQDLGRLAAYAFRNYHEELPWASRLLLRTMAGGANTEEADLMSYLYFHHRFTSVIEQLGFDDASRSEIDLLQLIEDDDVPY